jgi:hypothetical protein
MDLDMPMGMECSPHFDFEEWEIPVIHEEQEKQIEKSNDTVSVVSYIDLLCNENLDDFYKTLDLPAIAIPSIKAHLPQKRKMSRKEVKSLARRNKRSTLTTFCEYATANKRMSPFPGCENTPPKNPNNYHTRHSYCPEDMPCTPCLSYENGKSKGSCYFAQYSFF